jgi:hypothetical protein
MDDPLFGTSLDHTKTTPQEAMHIVAPALKAAGIAVADIILSTSSIYQAFKIVCVPLADDQKERFKPNTPLVEYFYEKLSPDRLNTGR